MKKKRGQLPVVPTVLCNFALCFTLLVFAPIDMYSLNSSNFWFTLSDFVPAFLVLFAISFAILQLVCILIGFLPEKINLILLTCIGWLMLSTYIQGNYLCMTNSVLSGGALQWNTMLRSAGFNALIWGSILLVLACIMMLKPTFFKKMISWLAGLVLIMEGTSLIATLINQSGVDTSSNYIYYGSDDEFTCSQNGDALVFMVDTLDTRLFDRIMEENPEFLEELDGFTYYRNASSSYRKTDPSFISILTGHLCRNEEPFFSDAAKAFAESAFLPKLNENSLTVNVYGGPYGLFTAETMTQVENLAIDHPEIQPWNGFIKTMLRMVGYRYAPTVFQPFVFGEYADEFEQYKKVQDGLPTNATYTDARYRNSYQRKGITVDNNRRFFKFYAMQGAHTPYNMNRYGETVESGSVDIYEKTLGAFTVLNEIFTGLKENGVYDKATIIILADHGDGWTCNPTLLVKYPESTIEGIVQSDAPVELLDVRATVFYGLGMPYEEFGTPVHLWEGTTERKRLFYAYDWVKPNGFDFYLSKLTEYEVPADATALDDYLPTGNYYQKEE